MEFTVTMKCSKCDQKFAGQGEHLVDAVTHMVESAAAGKHITKRLNKELEALSGKAEEVNIVGGILDILGLEPGQVHIIDDPGMMTQEEFGEFIQKHRDGDKHDGE
ncbi:MAG: hypothetical protein KAJ42_03425 [Gemmatimonadetes bacterium]|nr:hypothetical protein [Gemmatimonadota bacterium]